MDWIPFETVIQTNWHKSPSLASKVTDTLSFLDFVVIISYQSCQHLGCTLRLCLQALLAFTGWIILAVLHLQYSKCKQRPCQLDTLQSRDFMPKGGLAKSADISGHCSWARGRDAGFQNYKPRLYENSAAHGTVPTPEESGILPETSVLLDWETIIQRSLFWFAAKANLKIMGLIKKKIDCNQLGKNSKGIWRW